MITEAGKAEIEGKIYPQDPVRGPSMINYFKRPILKTILPKLKNTAFMESIRLCSP